MTLLNQTWGEWPAAEGRDLSVAVPGVERACLDEIQSGVQHDLPGAEPAAGLLTVLVGFA
jgi:hypothetical protein